MKKLFFFLSFLLVWPSIVSAQTEIVSYEYWWNNDFQQKNQVAVSPTNFLAINEVIPANHLNYGVHIFNFRAKDNQGFFSPTLSQFFQHLPASSGVQKNIIAYEYWMNDDYAQAVQVPISSAQQVNVQELLAMQNLPTGIHTFHIRFKDDAGFWSATASQFFYKQSSIVNYQGEILAYEYWYNDDYAAATKVNVTPQQNISIQELLNVAHLADGLHAFHIRFLDDKQLWSSTTSQFFYKTPSTITGATKEIVAYEYWLNDDYANVQTIQQSPQQVINVQELIPLSNLSNGLHVFHIRFQDNSNLWSSTTSQFIHKLPAQVSGNTEITAYKYWLGNQQSNAQTVAINPSSQQFILIDDLPLTHIPQGTYTIHFQFQDNNGRWSSATTDTIFKNPLPIADFAAD
ncbi:MAG: hypothetical protein JJT77_12190, partial [Crocinitomicaceae bacterium]|nr:hypothetical protein [Crocinitomicaceae bacterium]